MKTNELREKYLSFFESKGHSRCASDVLVSTWTPSVLFTPAAMIVAQTVLVTPIVAALARQTVEDLWTEYREQLRSLGASPGRALPTLLWDGRAALRTALVAGCGRASEEVGAVMTTAIALETSKGYLALALALGLVLIALSLAINGAAFVIRDATRPAHA